MQSRMTVAILSDIHYAGAAERQRTNYQNQGITSPALRVLINLYRRYIWLRDPFAHNHLLDHFIERARGADLVVANGDYSCDSAFVGVSDDAAFSSAAECLGKLRTSFGGRFRATFGDHEIGKRMMGGKNGGLRLASYHRARSGLGLETTWRADYGQYVLIGVMSTLLGLPVFESETLENEREEWRQLREDHFGEIRRVFEDINPQQRIILFCHDPTALPFLGQEPAVRQRFGQIERTVLGHLHSNLVLMKSRILAGMPPISFLGHTPRRLSKALRMARHWRPFNVFLCPSLAGIELLKDGGFCTMELDPTGREPARFCLHRFGRKLINASSERAPGTLAT